MAGQPFHTRMHILDSRYVRPVCKFEHLLQSLGQVLRLPDFMMRISNHLLYFGWVSHIFEDVPQSQLERRVLIPEFPQSRIKSILPFEESSCAIEAVAIMLYR